MTYVNFPIDNVIRSEVIAIPSGAGNISIRNLDSNARISLNKTLQKFFGKVLEEEEAEFLFEAVGKEIDRSEVERLQEILLNRMKYKNNVEQIEIRELKIKLRNIEKINDANKGEILEMLDKIAELGPKAKTLVPLLIELLVKLPDMDEENDVAQATVNAFVKIGKPAVPALIALFKSKVPEKIDRAAIVLGVMDSISVPALCELLKEDSINADHAIELLNRKVKMCKLDKKTRNYLILILIKAQRKALKNKKTEISAKITKTLINIGAYSAPHLVNLLFDKKNSKEERALAAYMLGEIAVKEQNKILNGLIMKSFAVVVLKELKSDDPKKEVLKEIYEALQKIKGMEENRKEEYRENEDFNGETI